MKKTFVINKSYGGFSLNKEMIEWLVNNKNWKLAPLDDYPHDDYDIAGNNNYYYLSTKWKNKEEFRSNPDLIEMVRYFKNKYKNINEYRCPKEIYSSVKIVNDLRIVDVEVNFDIEDVNDGIEDIIVNKFINEED